MSRLSDFLIDLTGKVPKRGTTVDQARTRQGVGRSGEWQRVAALPRRALDLRQVPDLSQVWRIDDHGCPGCDLCVDDFGNPTEAKLRPIQSAALLEAEAYGLFGPIGVGHGKELITLLLADAVQAERAVILTKPRLRSQMIEVDIPRYGRHFRLPMQRIAAILPYTQLSDADDLIKDPETDKLLSILDRIKPDWIFANEAHSLRNRTAMRTKIFWTYADKSPECGYVPLSGTFADDSINDYADHLERSLGPLSPVPSGFREVQDWSRALDVSEDHQMAPGALLDLCGPDAKEEEFAKLTKEEAVKITFAQPGSQEIARDVARRVYGRRLAETPGVVMTDSADDCRAELVLTGLRVELDPVVAEQLRLLRKLWKIGDDELREAKDVARYARQLAAGFYYRWAWPDGVKDEEWLEARSAWYKVVRHALRYLSARGLYSPLMVWRAAAAGELSAADCAVWRAWSEVHHRWRPHPPREAVWLSDFFLDDVVRWAEGCDSRAPGIVWYGHVELADRLEARGLRVFRGGAAEGASILRARDPVIAASIESYKDGQNLQHFCRARVTTPMSNNTAWQQLLGREHRSGQKASRVLVDVDAHDQSLQSAIAVAMRKARFVEPTQRQKQKLLQATRVDLDFTERDEPWAEAA